MQPYTLLAHRILHVGVLVVVVVVLLIALQDLPSITRAIVSILPVLAWYSGLLYERSLVLANGLVDKDELEATEREAARLLR